MRTIPSDKNQAEVIVELVKMLNWSYVSIVYEESSYGEKAYGEIYDRIRSEGLCLAVTDKLIKDSGVAADEAYDNIVKRLRGTPSARGWLFSAFILIFSFY